ncbi:PAQR family membrane homeostasis protein TrhA [Propionivibrio sp.]|jgi:hemolysin III|uniref:PAQR family membrane homeostasis protein TrhA n=1 Tax=Propionivibrio sp. TaxID=2212460 RepID=UPI0039E29A0F
MYYGERFNGYSHLAGALLALAGSVVLIVLGSLTGNAWKIVSFAIYGTTLVLLYSFSTLYHSTRGRLKAVFRELDHGSIYLLIAGTYTPFALVSLRGDWGWWLFGAIWGLAVAGIVQEFWLGKGARRLSLVIYLLMGWIALLATFPIIDAITLSGFAWVAAGGIVYTAGVVFYVYDHRFAHWHGIWHLFVLGGSALHYVAIALYVL